jgi:hypothetical protein
MVVTRMDTKRFYQTLDMLKIDILLIKQNSSKIVANKKKEHFGFIFTNFLLISMTI